MTRIALESEPAFVAVGPKCVACGMNNRGKMALLSRFAQSVRLADPESVAVSVWFYSIETRQLINDKVSQNKSP